MCPRKRLVSGAPRLLSWEVLEQRDRLGVRQTLLVWAVDETRAAGQEVLSRLSPPSVAKKNSAKIWGAGHLVSGEFSVPFQEERHLLPGSVLSEG